MRSERAVARVRRRGVEPGKLGEEQRARPAVERGVMRDRGHDVLAGTEPDDRGPERQVRREIERRTRETAQEIVERTRALRVVETRQIDPFHDEIRGLAHDRSGAPVAERDARPQRLVARDDPFERVRGRFDRKFTAHANGERHVVRVVRLELREKPQPFLSEGERRFGAGDVNGAERRGPAGRGIDASREPRDGRVLKDGA